MSIEIKNLIYSYCDDNQRYKALDDISVQMPSESFNVVIGETGSGKTTLMQHLNALLSVQSGTINIGGYLLSPDSKINKKDLRKKVGYVFQFPEYQLFEDTVLKDVCFGPKNFGSSDEEALIKAKAALDLVGLDASVYNTSPFELSGGQKRKVAIAGVLAIDPDIIILDEPTAGLDPIASKEIMELFTKLQKEHSKTIIMVTHNLDHVFNYGEYVVVMSSGKCVYQGIKKEFFENSSLLDELKLKLPKELLFKKLLISKGFDINLDDDFNTMINKVVREVK